MSFGFTEILLLVLLVLILFGAGKLPAVMGDLAKGVKNFKRGLTDEDDAQKPVATTQAPAPQATPTPVAAPDVVEHQTK